MRKLIVFICICCLAGAAYFGYANISLNKQLQIQSIDNANKANELSQKVADAQVLQASISSQEYEILAGKVMAGEEVAQVQSQAIQGNTDNLQQVMQQYVMSTDKPSFMDVWYTGSLYGTWTFSPTVLTNDTKVMWVFSDGNNMLAWVQADYDVNTNQFKNFVIHHTQYSDIDADSLNGSSTEAWY